MSQQYTPNKSKSKHLCYELRLHLARLWNRRIESNDAKLTLGSFARQMGLDEETWRREYYRGGGSKPVFDHVKLHRRLYGRYDPEAAQQEATLAASQRGARQRLTKPLYRLPTEAEWELAAGHMPKDADFNCGVGDATTPVDAYARTKGACGGADFWGNCWEWTSTARGDGANAVKGGAFDSPRTACRTEARDASRPAAQGYPNVTFRVVREDRE